MLLLLLLLRTTPPATGPFVPRRTRIAQKLWAVMLAGGSPRSPLFPPLLLLVLVLLVLLGIAMLPAR